MNEKRIIRLMSLYMIGFFLLWGSAVAENRSKRVWTTPLNIEILNTLGNDFAPTFNRFDKRIYFNSDRERGSKFYYCSVDDSLNISAPSLVSGSLNAKHSNSSYLSFESKDMAYLSAFDMKDIRSYMNIHSSGRLRDKLISPVLIEELADNSFNAHPTISPDGTMIIFASDRNSKGETDLWAAFKNIDNTWGSLIKITELSTPGNEITPFLASADTLLFASDGHEGPGGYDLFISVKFEGRWQAPDPLVGINTEANESDPLLLPNGRVVFTSDRPEGMGELDLYWSEPHDLKNDAGEIPNTTLFLSPQVSSVRVKTESFTEFFSPSRILFVNDSELFIDSSDLPDNQIAARPDSVYKYSLSILAAGLKGNPNSKMNLISSTDDKSVKFAERIKEYLLTKYAIADEQVSIISKESQSNKYLSTETSDYHLFLTLRLGKENIQLIPPILEISADARPRGHITNWDCNFSIENKLNKTVKTGNKLPEKFLIDLKPYKEDLSTGYSFTIDIRGRDSSGRIAEKHLEMSISHSSGNRLTVRDDKLYTSNVLMVDTETSVAAISDLYRQIAPELRPNSKIIVEYYSNKTVAAEKIKKQLQTIITQGEIVIRRNNVESKNISGRLRPFVFRILVEKI